MIMILLGIPGLLQWCSFALGASNPRSSTFPQCRETGCHPDNMLCFKYSLVFLVLEEWLLYPSYSWGSYAYVTASPTPPRYVFEVIIYFCYFCFSGLISFKQHLYCLGERSLTTPDGSPSRLNMLLESSYFMVMSLMGQMRPTTTGLQLLQRRKVALATAHPLNLEGESQDFLKDQQLNLNPQTHQWTISCLKECFVYNVAFDSHAVHVPRWHGKMKNLTSLDYSSDLHDDTNYIV